MLALVLHMRQLQIKRQRGFEVGKRLCHQRDAVVTLLGQCVEFVFGHGEPPQLCPVVMGRSFGQVLMQKLGINAGHGLGRVR